MTLRKCVFPISVAEGRAPFSFIIEIIPERLFVTVSHLFGSRRAIFSYSPAHLFVAKTVSFLDSGFTKDDKLKH